MDHNLTPMDIVTQYKKETDELLLILSSENEELLDVERMQRIIELRESLQVRLSIVSEDDNLILYEILKEIEHLNFDIIKKMEISKSSIGKKLNEIQNRKKAAEMYKNDQVYGAAFIDQEK